MNLEDNPYNIAEGTVVDMSCYLCRRFTDTSRPYMYAEILVLNDILDYEQISAK
jgi:hypothetical protein